MVVARRAAQIDAVDGLGWKAVAEGTGQQLDDGIQSLMASFDSLWPNAENATSFDAFVNSLNQSQLTS